MPSVESGQSSVRMFYVNAKNPAALGVSYSGPGMPLQPVPSSSLFFEAINTASENGLSPGLEYYCYDDTPASIDDVRNEALSPVRHGHRFYISLRVPQEYVAL